jgi:ParB family chromosome partitioning protein
LLTEGAVRASDKRARFIGEAYEAAGGTVLRDLFQGDDGGWLQDVALVERLMAERLEREVETVRAEGWRWIELSPDFPYGHTFGLRHLRGETVPLTAEEEAMREVLAEEYDRLEAEYAQAEEYPEEVDQRLEEIETALHTIEEHPAVFDLAEIARAGAFVSIDADGRLRVERGYVRPEDEVPIAPEPDTVGVDFTDAGPDHVAPAARTGSEGDAIYAAPQETAEPEEDEGIKPLPDRLLTELTAHRTLALRVALGEHREVAFLAALHAFCLRVFYSYALHSCLELDLKSVAFTAQAPGLNDTPLAQALTDRHQFWLATLPKQPEDLWDALSRLDLPKREALFAHCVGLSVNAVHEAYHRRPQALAHAGVLSHAVGLDMVAAGWTATADSYLGRVTKARIVEAVREAKGDQAAQAIATLKKGEMVERAQELLADTGWLPEKLRTPGQVFAARTPDAETEPQAHPEHAAVDTPQDVDAPVEHWQIAAE